VNPFISSEQQQQQQQRHGHRQQHNEKRPSKMSSGLQRLSLASIQLAWSWLDRKARRRPVNG